MEIVTKLNLVMLLCVFLLAIPLLYKYSDVLFLLTFVFPIVSLPLYVILKFEMGYVNIALEAICVGAFIISRTKSTAPSLYKETYLIGIILLVLITYGFVIGKDHVSLITALLGVKLLCLPFWLSQVAKFSHEFQFNLIRILFVVQILNAIFAVLETMAGPQVLQGLGFQYGTNQRNFGTVLRVPGLTLTNYLLGSFSAILGVLGYLVASKKLFARDSQVHLLSFASFISSVICLFLSSFRSGIVFTFSCIVFIELLGKKSFSRVTNVVIYGVVTILLASAGNVYLLSTSSSAERQVIWGRLLGQNDWIHGSGIGFTGAASRSSFANSMENIVTDNQYITLLLQFGILGILACLIIFGYFFIRTDYIGKGVLLATLMMMGYVEVWDMTVMFTLNLYLIHLGFQKDLREKMTFK